MVRQQGGIRWKQGTDGCIFVPAVECKDKDDQYSSNPAYVSKLMKKDSPDERTETILATDFAHVVKGKGVLISVERCTPRFSEDRNKNSSPNVKGKFIDPSRYESEKNKLNAMPPCQKINLENPEDYTNFILEKYADTTYYGICLEPEYKDDNKKKLNLLRRALNAAVALVPDDGPWILGYDFHINNIFVKMDPEPFTSLADWGRTIIIQDPKIPSSVKRGIQSELDRLVKEEWTLTGKFQDYGNKHTPQFEHIMRKALDDYLILIDAFSLNRLKNQIRLITIYGILKSAYTHVLDFDDELFTDLLFITKSQQDIINILNEKLKDESGMSKFIDLATFFPEAPSEETAPKGGKRTRKQKKTLKKKSKKHTRR